MAVNVYPATSRMPKLTIVVVDTIPVELKSSYMVWSWLIYVLLAESAVRIPLLWVAALVEFTPHPSPGKRSRRSQQ
ncbi:hypothetical protein ACLK17_07045 [Escherichia coli]